MNIPQRTTFLGDREVRFLTTEYRYPLASGNETRDEYMDSVSKYSTSIEAAWKVVEKIKTERFEITFVDYDEERQWMAGWDGICFEYGRTAPHAICLVALKAIEESRSCKTDNTL